MYAGIHFSINIKFVTCELSKTAKCFILSVVWIAVCFFPQRIFPVRATLARMEPLVEETALCTSVHVWMAMKGHTVKPVSQMLIADELST